MRKFSMLAAALICVSRFSFATSACSDASLSHYIGLGAGGCTIGTNTLSDFAALSSITGATPIPAGSILLSPFGSSTDPGLRVTVSVSVSAGALLQSLFTYRIAGGFYGHSAIALTGSSQTGDGAVTGIENFCAGGTFGPDGVSGCTTASGSLLTLNGTQNADSAFFGAAHFLSVTDDLTADGGLAGTASAGTLSNQFSTVPEPSTILLLAVGFLSAGVIRWKLTKRICS
ncbi:MAG: PEP-CTERM sorting domain-containing protein [Acidobacteriaceae bacterium]|nr:PEP-CTERM sorting domain-containing protein [Acidobacteriaceae bacterium]